MMILSPGNAPKKMYECAGFPKSRIWYKIGTHENRTKKEIHRAIKDGIKWLKENN